MFFCPYVDLDLTLCIHWNIEEYAVLQFEILLLKLAFYIGKGEVKGVEYSVNIIECALLIVVCAVCM